MKEFRLADGRRFAWREAGTGRPLILLHGWAMSSAVFAEVMAGLADEFRVLAPDLRGHGASDPGPGYLFADFAADLAEWMAALELEDAAAAGWSLGGQVLLELYPAVRGRISRMILTAVTPRFAIGEEWTAGLPDGQVRVMGRDMRRYYEKAMGDFFALQFSGEEMPRERYRRIVEFAVRGGRLPAPEVALAALETLRTVDLRRRAGEVDCPVLVVHGRLDRIVPPAAGAWLAGCLPAARYIEMPEVGHAPFLSRPEEVMRIWRKFLR